MSCVNGMIDDPIEVDNPRPAMNGHVQGHKSTFSGASTLISHSGGENAGRDDQAHDEDHEAQQLWSAAGAAVASPGSARKHHCSTEYAIGENRRIYIGNLTFSLERSDIAKLLHDQGVYKPDCCCIYVPPPSTRKNPKTAPEHRNRGYCFATFRDSDSARLAMERLDHIDYAGRKLVCRRCLPKGLTYSEFRAREQFIKQGGALGLALASKEEGEEGVPGGVRQQQHDLLHDDQGASYDEDSPSQLPRHHRRQHHYHHPQSSSSSGSATRQRHHERRESPGQPRPKFRNRFHKNRPTRQDINWYHHEDGRHMTPEQRIMPESMFMPKYYQNVYEQPPPAFGPFAGFFSDYERERVAENAAAANSYNGGGGGAVVVECPYRPPHDSSKADDRTIELLNLPPARGGYPGFKAYIVQILEGFNVTGVSEPIYQYNPNRPPFPLIRKNRGPVASYYYAAYCPEFPHQCPLFYCYVQFGSKEEAVRASEKLNSKEYIHGGDVRKYRANTEWKLHNTD
ncbi:RNA recognition motif domain-containing protein [Apiospora hydei]|uniref:RNA recognition motif domain-containing protein n=1 Tax=Apiospora hydei TaxID=1337664 RepID=A0ABR1X2J3_9PEZI